MLARQVRFGLCEWGTTSIRVVSEAQRAMRLHEYSVFARFRYNDLKVRLCHFQVERLPDAINSLKVMVRPYSGHVCRRCECRRILPDEILHTQRLLPGQRADVARYPVVASCAVEIGHRREVVH